MAFYRQGRQRLTDVQLMVSLHADGLWAGVYVGAPARSVWQRVRAELVDRGEGVLCAVLPLLQLKIYTKKGELQLRHSADVSTALSRVLRGAEGLWVGAGLLREAVLQYGAAVVFWVLQIWQRAWPLYRFCCAVSR